MTADDGAGAASVTGYVAPVNDHLAAEITAAVERFAQEDGCTPLEWVMRSARFCALTRLRMEADLDLNGSAKTRLLEGEPSC